MVGRLITCLLALLAVAQAEPLRLRRQADTASTPSRLPFSSMETPCPARCILKLTQAWTKAVSFEIPTANMVDDAVFLGNNDTFRLMCSLYASYSTCLRACDASNSDVNKAARDASPSLSEVCTDKQHEFDDSAPCLANHTKIFQTVCRKENEDALASATRLTLPERLQPDLLNDYCMQANRQLFCLFPLIRQTCGDSPYDLIRTIANASFISVRVSIGDARITALFPECEKYLVTIGEVAPFLFGNTTLNATDSNSTSVHVDTTTALYTSAVLLYPNTTTAENATGSMRRDDADGPHEPDGERFDGSGAPRFQTTTPSKASTSSYNFFILFTFSLVFIFL